MTTYQEYLQNGVPAPVAEALTAYLEGRATAFIFHYNVLDYVQPSKFMRLADYLVLALRTRDLIVMYDPARGIRFPDLRDQNGKSRTAQMEDTFRRVTGLDQQGPDPLAGLGLTTTNQKPPLPKTPEVVLPLLGMVARSEEVRAVIILEYMEYVIPTSQNAMMQPADRLALMNLTQWGNDPTVISPIFMITPSLDELHPAIRAASRQWHTIEMPLPDYARRLEFIESWFETRAKDQGVDFTLEKGLDSEVLARATAGLTLIGIEDIFLKAGGTGVLSYDLVSQLKRATVEKEFAGLVEFVDPRIGFEDIGGLWHIKEYFRENVINPMRTGEKSIVPMGVGMYGPPGTGKTVTAEAVAHESGLNMLKLNIGGQIASKWQGEGERNLRRVLIAAKQFAPCLIFIDEIDQAVSRGNGAGGNQQESRIFQILLEFMSDTSHRGEIVFLLASNRPDLMDAAFKRPGRIDDRLLFPIPESDERESLFKVMVKKYEIGKIKTIPAACISLTNGWTGAEIEAVARKARKLIKIKGQKPDEALVNAVSSIKPTTQDIQTMTILGLLECKSDLDYLPEKYRKQAQEEDLQASFEAKASPQFRGKRSI